MKTFRFSVLVIIAILLSSCAKRIDASSEEAMGKSIQEIVKSLNDDKKEKFQESLQLIMFHGLEFGDLIQEGGSDGVITDVISLLDGKTANEIISEGEKIKLEIERKKKEQAKGEIEELYEKMKQADSDRKMLAKFEVKRSRFYKKRKGTYYITEEPIIELTVLNGTNHAISRAYFNGVIASPERSVPWLTEDFSYQISGGVEPGEEVAWSLAPNSFSEWGQVDAPNDAVFTVEVIRLDGPDGEALYSTRGFGEYEQERLEELLKAYPEFEK